MPKAPKAQAGQNGNRVFPRLRSTKNNEFDANLPRIILTSRILVLWPSIAGLFGVVVLAVFGPVSLVFGSGLRPANWLISLRVVYWHLLCSAGGSMHGRGRIKLLREGSNKKQIYEETRRFFFFPKIYEQAEEKFVFCVFEGFLRWPRGWPKRVFGLFDAYMGFPSV